MCLLEEEWISLVYNVIFQSLSGLQTLPTAMCESHKLGLQFCLFCHAYSKRQENSAEPKFIIQAETYKQILSRKAVLHKICKWDIRDYLQDKL